jgi:hypothetical protein
VSSSQAIHGGRIETRYVGGRVVVCVRGDELFDVADDFLTTALDAEIRYRLPATSTASALATHELILPEHVGLDTIRTLLDGLPAEQVQAAQVADGAT